MTCDRATFMLERRWDKTLSGEEERALDEHIRECETCREEAEAIAFADATFLKIPECVPPMDIAAAVARRVAAECPAEPRRGWFWMAIIVVMASIATAWHFGFAVPAAVLSGPQFKAAHDIAATMWGTVQTWLMPVIAVVRSLAPAAPVLIPIAAVAAAVETAALGTWVLKRGSHRQLTGRV